MADLLRLRDVLMLGVLAEAWSMGTPHEQLEAAYRGMFECSAHRVGQGEPICTVDWKKL